jgi:hypothetical protein
MEPLFVKNYCSGKLQELISTNDSFVGPFDLEITSPVPRYPGLYFWFMTDEGLKTLLNNCQFLDFHALKIRVVNDLYLVYIGKSKSSLYYRILKWHCEQLITIKAIGDGTISTLRITLASSLVEDLSEPDADSKVNEFMKKYMKVGFISYREKSISQLEVDEKLLINEIQPILNLPSGRNVKEPKTIQQYIKLRRKELKTRTFEKLNIGVLPVVKTKKENIHIAPKVAHFSSHGRVYKLYFEGKNPRIENWSGKVKNCLVDANRYNGWNLALTNSNGKFLGTNTVANLIYRHLKNNDAVSSNT